MTDAAEWSKFIIDHLYFCMSNAPVTSTHDRKWVMNDEWFREVLIIWNSLGAPYHEPSWTPGIASPDPSMLFGYPIQVVHNDPDITVPMLVQAGPKPVLGVDFINGINQYS